MAGRATRSRMNRTIASNMFMNRPRLTGCRAACRASGMITAATRIAATTSITMNRVTCNPNRFGKTISTP